MTNISNFKLIAHRGLLRGPSKEKENNLELLKNNIINYPFMINEVDIWIDKKIYLGHEESNHFIDPDFLIENSKNLILHIKHINSNNIYSSKYLDLLHNNCHFYSHDTDDFTVTNRGWIWSHPRLGVVPNTICVMPETFISIYSDEFSSKLKLLSGVCTDFPINLMKKNNINF